MHEKASGILRIFGVAPGTDRPPPRAQLRRREEEVADLVAQSLSRTAVARRPFLSPATIANTCPESSRSWAAHLVWISLPRLWNRGCPSRPAGCRARADCGCHQQPELSLGRHDVISWA